MTKRFSLRLWINSSKKATRRTDLFSPSLVYWLSLFHEYKSVEWVHRVGKCSMEVSWLELTLGLLTVLLSSWRIKPQSRNQSAGVWLLVTSPAVGLLENLDSPPVSLLTAVHLLSHICPSVWTVCVWWFFCCFISHAVHHRHVYRDNVWVLLLQLFSTFTCRNLVTVKSGCSRSVDRRPPYLNYFKISRFSFRRVVRTSSCSSLTQAGLTLLLTVWLAGEGKVSG